MNALLIITVKTWKDAAAYIRDIADGETLAFGVGNRYPERYTAIKMDAWSGEGHGYTLHRNETPDRLGPVVALINVNPQTGIAYD